MKVALVTGASSGIGAAIAIEFADAGWSVMAAGRDEARLAEVADASDNIATWEGDLESSADCDELISDTVDEFGRLDCLVNSAGILIRAETADTTDDAWRDTMAINVDVPFLSQSFGNAAPRGRRRKYCEHLFLLGIAGRSLITSPIARARVP